jgi:hypothetical protein
MTTPTSGALLGIKQSPDPLVRPQFEPVQVPDVLQDNSVLRRHGDCRGIDLPFHRADVTLG